MSRSFDWEKNYKARLCNLRGIEIDFEGTITDKQRDASNSYNTDQKAAAIKRAVAHSKSLVANLAPANEKQRKNQLRSITQIYEGLPEKDRASARGLMMKREIEKLTGTLTVIAKGNILRVSPTAKRKVKK
jgi:hypothetical protein